MNRRKLVHLAFAALLLGAMPSVPEVAHAAPPAAQAKGKVDLQVHVIHATEAHSNVDPRLEQLTCATSGTPATSYSRPKRCR